MLPALAWRRGAGTREVADAELLAHQADPGTAAVIEHPDLGRDVVADGLRADHRRAQDVLRLVEGRDQHRHLAAGQRGGDLAPGDAPAREGEQGQHGETVGLGDGERCAEPHRRAVEREAPPPHDVDEARGQGRDDDQVGPEAHGRGGDAVAPADEALGGERSRWRWDPSLGRRWARWAVLGCPSAGAASDLTHPGGNLSAARERPPSPAGSSDFRPRRAPSGRRARGGAGGPPRAPAASRSPPARGAAPPGRARGRGGPSRSRARRS